MTDRKTTQEALVHNERLLRLVLDAIPVGVAVMDRAGDIILVNPASVALWARIIRPGAERYARSKGWWHDSGKKLQPDDWPSVRARLKGETRLNEIIDIEAFDGTRKVMQNSAVPIQDEHGMLAGAVVVIEDISARKTTDRELKDSAKQMQTLATRLMHVQDEERRRTAQMLHETAAQDLAGLKMLLARLARGADLSNANRSILDEGVELAERAMGGIRTLSYLLYPPFLDQCGLLSAIRWYAQGFGQRSGISVDLDLPATFERLPRDVETALFRVLQEALINIHRHAQSETAHISLRRDDARLTLEITDDGIGMPAEQLQRSMAAGGALGVGIPGMHQRLKQLGGMFEIDSTEGGTVVRAILPLPFSVTER